MGGESIRSSPVDGSFTVLTVWAPGNRVSGEPRYDPVAPPPPKNCCSSLKTVYVDIHFPVGLTPKISLDILLIELVHYDIRVRDFSGKIAKILPAVLHLLLQTLKTASSIHRSIYVFCLMDIDLAYLNTFHLFRTLSRTGSAVVCILK